MQVILPENTLAGGHQTAHLGPNGAYYIPRMISRPEKLPTDTARWADVVHAHNVYSIFTTYAA
jgi:hypothetical protein